MQDVGAGLWHTVCTSIDGDVYSFGGNQFGQLGTGSDQAEVWSSGFMLIYADYRIWYLERGTLSA
jgi:alpha-tubulin suppressor-like RCC1 family protein